MPEPSARLRSLVEPLVEEVGLYLFDLEQTGGKLIVTVDAPQGSADMAAIAAATKAISRALDTDDPITGKYLLEVTSPGLERPLRTPAHYRWAIGKEITVRTVPEFEGERRCSGVLRSVDESGITLALAADPDATVTLGYDDILKARTVFDFDAELKAAKHDKPGGSGPTASRRGATAG